jgi:hypothetical protein
MKWVSIFTRELPLRAQLVTFLAGQAVWLIALAAVELKARANFHALVRFADERLVYTLVCLWMPLVLSVAWLVLSGRHGPAHQLNRVEKVLYRIGTGLSCINFLVALMCCVWVLGVGNVRE